MALGVDNVLFSVDWPYESNVAAVEFLKRQPLDPHQMEKVAQETPSVFYVFDA
jgi:2,3-dihydroxybenzoate decarboxylase